MDEYSLTHTKWNCKYHIVFTPKFRRKAIAEYVKNQEKEDMMEDQKSLKEYIDPFKK